MPATFGSEIRRARISKGLSLKEVADHVLKEDGAPISPQYLNDMEHARRNPPSESTIEKLASALGLPRDYLLFLAGQLPAELRAGQHKPEAVESAFRAFRSALRKG